MRKPYEVMEHTADLGLRVFGESLEALYANAALGLMTLMIDMADVAEREKARVTVRGGDRVGLFVSWLHEMLVRFETDGFLTASVVVEEARDTILTACLRGERYDPARHELRREIKAVTYHGARVEQCGDGWVAEVIFDL